MKWKYILKRILIAIPTFFGITILAYFILNMAPGSPLDALLADPGITPAELNIINLRKKWKGICSQVSFIVLKYGQGCI